MKYFSFLLLSFFSVNCVFAQTGNVGIGTSSPKASAALDISSSTKGLLIPRMATAQRNAIAAPEKGLMVYDTSVAEFHYYDGGKWRRFSEENNDSSSYFPSFVSSFNTLNFPFNSSNYITENQTNGIIFDNGGSSGNYSDAQSAFIYISKNATALSVRIIIEQMNTAPGDSLTISGVDLSSGSPVSYRYGGTQLDTIYFSGHDDIFLSFFSNATVNAPGFKIRWQRHVLPYVPQPVDGYSPTGWFFQKNNFSIMGGRQELPSYGWGSGNGDFSFSYGLGSRAFGRYGFAAGYHSTTSLFSDAAFAMGNTTNATGNSSVALGYKTTSKGDRSTAMGDRSTASGSTSTAMGYLTDALGSNTTAMGNNTIAKGYSSTVMGMYNDSILTTNQIGETTTTPLFIVGNGNSNIDRSNALVVLKNGNTGINTSAPKSAMHVIRNDSSGGPKKPNAIAILESNQSGYLQFSNTDATESGILAGNFSTSIRSAMLFRADSSIQLRAGGNSTKVFIEKTGNVGIGTQAPAALLDVNGPTIIGSNGTALTEIIKVTVSKNVAAVSANSSVTESFTVANSQPNSTVYVSPASSLSDGLLIAYARVSTAGTVEVKFTNTTGAPIDPATMNFFITVIR
jgi:hypothetical protein